MFTSHFVLVKLVCMFDLPLLVGFSSLPLPASLTGINLANSAQATTPPAAAGILTQAGPSTPIMVTSTSPSSTVTQSTPSPNIDLSSSTAGFSLSISTPQYQLELSSKSMPGCTWTCKTCWETMQQYDARLRMLTELSAQTSSSSPHNASGRLPRFNLGCVA